MFSMFLWSHISRCVYCKLTLYDIFSKARKVGTHNDKNVLKSTYFQKKTTHVKAGKHEQWFSYIEMFEIFLKHNKQVLKVKFNCVTRWLALWQIRFVTYSKFKFKVIRWIIIIYSHLRSFKCLGLIKIKNENNYIKTSRPRTTDKIIWWNQWTVDLTLSIYTTIEAYYYLSYIFLNSIKPHCTNHIYIYTTNVYTLFRNIEVKYCVKLCKKLSPVFNVVYRSRKNKFQDVPVLGKKLIV